MILKFTICIYIYICVNIIILKWVSQHSIFEFVHAGHTAQDQYLLFFGRRIHMLMSDYKLIVVSNINHPASQVSEPESTQQIQIFSSGLTNIWRTVIATLPDSENDLHF